MLPIRTILHPTDFSENSQFAFPLACALARDYGARLIVLHVIVPPVAVHAGELVVPPPEGYRAPLYDQLRQIQAPDATVRLEHRMTEGEAAAEIVHAAVETGADFIVMGTHGRTGLARLLMGSVAEQVLRKAACPVVTVKAPFAEARVVERAVQAEPAPAG